MMSPCSLVRPFVLSKVSESEREEERREGSSQQHPLCRRTRPTDCHFKCRPSPSPLLVPRWTRERPCALFFILFLICIVRRPLVRLSLPHIRLL